MSRSVGEEGCPTHLLKRMLSPEALIQSPHVVSTDAGLHQLTVHRDTVSMAGVLS